MYIYINRQHFHIDIKHSNIYSFLFPLIDRLRFPLRLCHWSRALRNRGDDSLRLPDRPPGVGPSVGKGRSRATFIHVRSSNIYKYVEREGLGLTRMYMYGCIHI